MVTTNSKNPVAWIVDHNPFYLLSAVCMLFGCYALQHAMNVQAGELWKLVGLLVTINIYELLLVGLGYLLYVRCRLVRDAGCVLMIELLFLVDAAFLNGETVTTDLWVGGAINVLLLLLGVFKVWVLLRAIRAPEAGRILAFVALELAVLYVMPGFFRRIGPEGTVSGTALYGVWWVVGALPFLRDAIMALSRRNAPPRPEETRFVTVFVGAFTVVPYLSLLAHLWIMHWLYEAPFYCANLTPILLALTLASRRLRPSRLLPAHDIAFVRVVLPLAAVLFSAGNPVELWQHVGTHVITPSELALAATFLTGVYCFLPRYRLLTLAVGAVGGLLAIYREALLLLGQGLIQTGSRVGNWVQSLIPQSAETWGLIAVGAGFVLLALGAWISMRGTVAVAGGIMNGDPRPDAASHGAGEGSGNP